MRLVSDITDKEIEESEALDEMGYDLRILASNIIRVVRGAGNPALIGSQAASILRAMERYRKSAGAYPRSEAIADALKLPTQDGSTIADRGQREWVEGIERMIRGGLQMAASRLVAQTTQERAGENEMFQGLAPIEEQRAENRRIFLAPVPAKKVRKPSRSRT